MSHANPVRVGGGGHSNGATEENIDRIKARYPEASRAVIKCAAAPRI